MNEEPFGAARQVAMVRLSCLGAQRTEHEPQLTKR